MPTRADWQAAAPKCPQKGDRALARGGAGQTVRVALNVQCAKPMRYDASGRVWVCPHHGAVLAGTLAAAQLAAAMSDAA